MKTASRIAPEKALIVDSLPSNEVILNGLNHDSEGFSESGVAWLV